MMPCTIPAGWSVGSENPIAAGRLATELNIHPLLARLLAARGLNNPAQAAAFLDPHPTWSLEPRALAATVAAADAIRRAIKNDELILVHGDYDVDGLTATAILVRTLKALGGRCITYIPHRLNQGYGLGPGLPELVRRAGVGLLITADCGSGDSGVIDILVREGLRVVVTDHHQPGKPLPAGVIELNPKALTGEPAWINLCGAGVAFILARELLDQSGLAHIPLVGSSLKPFMWGMAAHQHCYGPRKISMLTQRGYPPPWVATYTDHECDLPVMRQSAACFLVNPRPKAVRIIADALSITPEVLSWR